MPIDITAGRSPEDVLPALAPIFHYFGITPGSTDAPRFVPFIEPARAFAARENGTIVGGCASFPFELTVPGGAVKASGLTVVGVRPTHRRRGILRGMMRAHLDDTRRRGEPIAALWASEDTIYGQFGYGQASFCGNIDMLRTSGAFAQRFEPRGTFTTLGEADAAAPLSEVYERVRLQYPGMLSRSADWWTHRRLWDPENRRMGGGELNRVLLSHDGRPSGYALYRIHPNFEAGMSTGYVNVIEAIGATPEATREIWRFLFDIDWLPRIKAQLLPLDHELFFLLARPREMHFQVHDGLWVRLVDLPEAIAARRLGDAEPVVFEIEDAFCNWNAGRWRVGPQGAVRTKEAAQIACDVTALGAAYLGGFRVSQLARAGRVAELVPGALARADALFAAERAPWCPEIF